MLGINFTFTGTLIPIISLNGNLTIYSATNNKLELALQTLEESKVSLGRISQNSDYIKKEITYLYKNLDKIIIAEHNKEIVLPSAGIVEFTRSLNSERWKYLRASLKETSHSS